MARTKVMMTDEPTPPVPAPDPATATDEGAVAAVSVPDPVPDPVVALDDDGVERPLSGGSFVMIDGRLVREEEA